MSSGVLCIINGTIYSNSVIGVAAYGSSFSFSINNINAGTLTATYGPTGIEYDLTAIP
jgi:hypothetical protein